MCCWIGVGPPCPTRPPHQQGTELVDELLGTWSCDSSRIFNQSAISGTMVHGYHGTIKLPPTRGSLPPLSSSGGWTGNLPMLLLLSLCCRRFLVGDVLVMCWRLSRSLCCRRVWRCAGDVLAGIILRPISPYAGWTGICHAAVLSLCCRRVLVGDVLVIVLAAVAVTVLSPGVAMCW